MMLVIKLSPDIFDGCIAYLNQTIPMTMVEQGRYESYSHTSSFESHLPQLHIESIVKTADVVSSMSRLSLISSLYRDDWNNTCRRRYCIFAERILQSLYAQQLHHTSSQINISTSDIGQIYITPDFPMSFVMLSHKQHT